MVNKDMNGFPVKKCSAFQFFKKRVRRWIKSPMVSVDKHQSPNLKYTGPAGLHLPPGEPDFEPALCQACLGDHAFQRGMLPADKESCSWEIQPDCEVKEPCNHANILTKPDPRTFWTNDDSGWATEQYLWGLLKLCRAMRESDTLEQFSQRTRSPSRLHLSAGSGIFQPCLVLAKSTKKAFSEATRPCTRAVCLFWDRGRKSCRPESRRLLQGNVSVRRSPSPAARPRSLPMGEMQGARARARLESLLRPRHKKRAEAQKRSESVLLSGLGKRRRPAGLGRARMRPEPRRDAGRGARRPEAEDRAGEDSPGCRAPGLRGLETIRARREPRGRRGESVPQPGLRSALRSRSRAKMENYPGRPAPPVPAACASLAPARLVGGRGPPRPSARSPRTPRPPRGPSRPQRSARCTAQAPAGAGLRAGAGPKPGGGAAPLPHCSSGPAPAAAQAYKAGSSARPQLAESISASAYLSDLFGAMTVKTEAARGTLTYSRMRGMVAMLIAFMKQRRMGLNDFIQKIANNSYACKHPEVQSILKISQPQEPELMNANPSPPPSPSQQINLGPSSNPHAKPSDFHFLKVIGKGSFGKVLLARHKAEEAFYAVKVLQKKAILKKKEEKHIMSERNVLLKNVKHPFLVGLHFSFQTADKLYFVLDYINGGELFYHLQRERCFLEPRARFYAAEIASALGYLHSLNIVYRDLKPENILLDSQGHIVLTDFGLCKENIEPNGTTSTFCGTPEYLAPEVLHKQPYDRTVDWWCLGAVLYEMLYGLPPFYSRNTAEMYDNILNKPLQLKPNITNSARHLLEGLLQKDRTKRLGAKDDFMEIKSHVFFSLINWDDLINKKIIPPFNPNVSGPSDLRHFDPEFTEEPVPNSIGRSPDSILVTASVKEAAEAFLGFSYAPPMDSFL